MALWKTVCSEYTKYWSGWCAEYTRYWLNHNVTLGQTCIKPEGDAAITHQMLLHQQHTLQLAHLVIRVTRAKNQQGQ